MRVVREPRALTDWPGGGGLLVLVSAGSHNALIIIEQLDTRDPGTLMQIVDIVQLSGAPGGPIKKANWSQEFRRGPGFFMLKIDI
jgi:hypothetical protein